MILALETASPTTRAWLASPGHIPSVPDLEWDSGRQLADELLGQIMDLLGTRKLKLSDLSGLIVFSGPGSFTSLRIGHTVANALADSLGIPVVGARGEHWLKEGIQALQSPGPHAIALPFYGSEANITRPKA